MIKVGILGDIGSGKSYVAQNFGYQVFNADVEVAKLYKDISFDKILSNKLNVMDATAIVMCRDNNLSLRVFNMLKPNTLVKAMTDNSVGTSVGI